MTTPNRALLRQKLSEILDASPEHNTTAEHDALLDRVMGALGGILEGVGEVTTPNPVEHDSPHLHLGRCGCTCDRCHDGSGAHDDNHGCICKECSC